jgi:hypothetical protein
MVAKDGSQMQSYFSRSPFRSAAFIGCTLIFGFFVAWALRLSVAVRGRNPSASNAIEALVALVVFVWLESLFLHWELRNVLDATSNISSQSRLRRLHWGLVLGVVVMACIVIGALTVTYPRISGP